MALQNGQDLQQMQMQQQPQQQQLPPTMLQRAIKREKWIVILTVIFGILGVIEHIIAGKNIGNLFTVYMINFVGLTILNFTVVAWLQRVYLNSKRASQNFWSQRD